jgi:hypothetical protein
VAGVQAPAAVVTAIPAPGLCNPAD